MKTNVGIIGATGYTGFELIRLLNFHNKVTIKEISSISNLGENISDIYPALYKIFDKELVTEDTVIENCDVIFSCLPHGLSEESAKKCLAQNKIFIDLSADFRLKSEEEYKKWYDKNFIYKELHEKAVYGMPELFLDEIKSAKLIANPGCYPTSIALSLYPLIKNNLIDTKNIIIDSKSGVTGSGKSPSATTHFASLNESFKPYGIFTHRHTPEINQVLSTASSENITVTFTPHLLPINRGIISTIYTKVSSDIKLEKIRETFLNFYKDKPFVRIKKDGDIANLKDVKYTNYIDISIHLNTETSTLIIVGCIDNMVKGASGQAIQNMNIVLGFNENEGLDIIPTAF